jgi:hypothetical protein
LSTDVLVWPMLAQVLLSALIAVRMGFLRWSTGARDGIRTYEVATRSKMAARMPSLENTSDSFQNQFETPLLFLVAMLLAMQLGIADLPLLVMAWMWVLLRHIHAAIHLTYNRVRHRFRAFAASLLVLATIWIYIVFMLVSR